MFLSSSLKVFLKTVRLTAFSVFLLNSLILIQAKEIFAQSKRMTLSTNESIILILIVLLFVSLIAAFVWRKFKQNANLANPGSSTLALSDPRGVGDKISDNSDSEKEAELNSYINEFLEIHETNAQTLLLGQTNPDGSRSSKNNVEVEEGRPRALPTFEALPPSAPILPLPVLTDESLLTALEQLKNSELGAEEREEILNALSQSKTRHTAEALAQTALHDESAKLRGQAVLMLSELDHESVFEPILLSCADSAREVRAAAARALSRLNINRTEAFVRVIESKEAERMRLIARACIEAGLAKHAFDRLMHEDRKQAREAFAIIYLLTEAGAYDSIVHVIKNHAQIETRLVTIHALRTIKPQKMLPRLRQISINELPSEIQPAFKELINELNALN